MNREIYVHRIAYLPGPLSSSFRSCEQNVLHAQAVPFTGNICEMLPILTHCCVLRKFCLHGGCSWASRQILVFSSFVIFREGHARHRTRIGVSSFFFWHLRPPQPIPTQEPLGLLRGRRLLAPRRGGGGARKQEKDNMQDSVPTDFIMSCESMSHRCVFT